MTFNPTPEHQQLVQALVNHFRSTLNFSINGVDLPGYAVKPFQIGRHTPDIIAKDSLGVIQIGDAKYGDDISSETSKEEFLDFSNQKMRITGQNVPLHIVVFKFDEFKLISRLNNIGLGYKIGNLIKIWTL